MTELMNPELSGSESIHEELTTPATAITKTEEAEKNVEPVAQTKEADSHTTVPILTDEHVELTESSEEETVLHELEDELPNFGTYPKSKLLELLVNLGDKPIEESARILKAVKPVLDGILQDEYNNALHKYIEDGGEKDDFKYQDKEFARETYNKAAKDLKLKRAEEKNRQDAERVENLGKKENILQQIRQLTEDEETEGSLKKLKDLQNEWKQIRNVPKDQIERLWESYHILIHQFYDRLSIYNELKDLDRKKNLDHKIELIQKVAELALEPSAKRALILLKKFQEDWKSIGPVPQESNEEIWNRFKHESDKIYEMIRSVQEQNQKVREENLAAKKELLVKALTLSNYQTAKVKDWFEQNVVANQLMEDWKKIGMVPLKFRESLWNEFRNARNQFYSNKNNFFKTLNAERNANLKAKVELCEKAEQISNNPIDLNRQTDEIKRLQDSWKKTGAVPERYSDAIWKRFRAACDLFFEKKAASYSAQIEEHKANLTIKKRIITDLEQLLQKDESTDILTELKSLQDEWNSTGYVPLNEKENLHKQYSNLNDQAFQKFKEVSKELKEIKEKSHLEALLNSPNGDMKIKREEKQLMDRIRGLRNDMLTWDNNLGFFTKGNSKTENPMVKQIEEKIDQAKKQLEHLEVKLKTIRSFLRQTNKI